MVNNRILIFVLVACLLIGTTLIMQPITTGNIIQEHIQQEQELNDIRTKTERIEKLITNAGNYDGFRSLYIMVYEVVSILLGHNMLSRYLSRMCINWFVLPCVMVMELSNFTWQGGFLEILDSYLCNIKLDDLFYKVGLVAFVIYPFLFTLCLVQSILDFASSGFNIQGGWWQRVTEAIMYIYRNPTPPDYMLTIHYPNIHHYGLLGCLVIPVSLSVFVSLYNIGFFPKMHDESFYLGKTFFDRHPMISNLF